ncbi:hypothetical protein Goshw_018397 [Gossypium schwendimanii]|uniref:Uncharacterized protein n=1 Tax=Gossypium schwendimanii TaxID=34291 RepID=A0A7J9LNZ4_GOSSC|nr:hypothetical protein [Gossypium schwendimanii]
MVSWKDKALGRGSSIFGCEEDLEFLEGDITMTTINGVPVINFFERIQKILVRVMATTMVVKLLGRNLVYSILQNRIFNLWKPSHSFHLMDIENAYFLAKFQSREDYEMIYVLMQDLCPYNEPVNADAKVKDANKMNLPVKEKLGDITRTTINGVPEINVFERIYKILVRDMATMVVEKLLG